MQLNKVRRQVEGNIKSNYEEQNLPGEQLSLDEYLGLRKPQL